MAVQSQAAGDARVGRIRTVVLLLFFCSGVSCLIYEVVWTRLLTVILGNTVFAVSTVLTGFMAGLALGSLFGGRLIDRNRRPLLVYALLEIAIGLLGLLLWAVLNQTGPVYVWIHTSLSAHPLLLYVARYVFSFCLLAIPTTLMGATLPVLSKFVVDSEWGVGLNLGRLYALNTLGAAVGCYTAGFVLIGNIGIGATVRAASALSIAVGGLALLCQRQVGPAAPATSAQPVEIAASGRTRSPLRLLILAAMAVSGFAALGYEVLWTRLLTVYLGNSVYAFATMLTAFLTGLALGSLVFSGFVDRRRRLITGLGIIEAGIGLCVLLSIYMLGWHAESLRSLVEPEPEWQGTGIRFMKAFALMLVPTFLMGAAFPVAGRIYVTNFQRLGRSVGELYTWNTLGAILGAAVAGFALIPILGLQASLVVLLCLNLLAAAALCAADPAVQRKTRFLLPAALAATAGVALVAMPRDVFRQMHEALAYPAKLVYLKEDLLGTVAVREKGSDRTLLIDNLEMAGNDESFLSSQKSLGHLPMLLHPNPQEVYVLGFGGGGTAGAISTYPEVRRIDATELSRAVVDVAGMFRDINHDVLSDPRLHLEVNDGRHFLLTARRTYDVISVDLLWPQTAGAGSLYTKEFYQLCHRRLNDDGIMVEWLHPGFIPTPYLQMVLRTIRAVFPHTSLWWARRQEHLLVIASKAPLRVDAQRLARRMSRPATQRDLAEAHLDEPAAFLSYFIAADEALAEFVAGSDWLNTDDLPLIEYKLPFYSGYAAPENLRATRRIQSSVLPLLERASAEQKQRIRICQHSNDLLYDAIIAFHDGDPGRAVLKCRQALQLNPDNDDAKHVLVQIHLAFTGRRDVPR